MSPASLLVIFATSFGVGVSGAMIPGPLLAAARGARLMSSKVYRGVLWGCGLFLLVLGGYFIVGALGGSFGPSA